MNTQTTEEMKDGAAPALAGTSGSAIQEPQYNWEIEIVAERKEDTGPRVRFIGTYREASDKADSLADGAPCEVRECVLHRCGPVSPTTVMSRAHSNNP
jgi:hypothetical protein